MQGVRFRKYIRGNFFDLELFAQDLAFSMSLDNPIHANGKVIIECFEAAQLVTRAEHDEDYALDTAEGCFGLYSIAIGLIGTHVALNNEKPSETLFHDDSWIDESWPTSLVVLNHMNAQMMSSLLNDTKPFIQDRDPDRRRVNDYIDAALSFPVKESAADAIVYKMF